MRRTVIFVFFSAALAAPSAPAPANPNASIKAKSILAYFQSLPDRADHRVVSGQFTDFGEVLCPMLYQRKQGQKSHAFIPILS